MPGDTEMCLPELEQLTIFDPAGGVIAELGEPTNWTRLSWSPDIRYLAAIRAPSGVDSTGEAVLFELETGNEIMLDLEGSPAHTITWSPDSSRMLVGTATGGFVTGVNGDRIGRIPETVSAITWTPDSERLVSVRDNWVSVFDATGNMLFRSSTGDIATQTGTDASGQFAGVGVTGTQVSAMLIGTSSENPPGWIVRGEIGSDGLVWTNAEKSETPFRSVPWDQQVGSRLVEQLPDAVGFGIIGYCSLCLPSEWRVDSALFETMGRPGEPTSRFVIWRRGDRSDYMPLPDVLRVPNISFDVGLND
jgi:hypothetical protein